MMFRQRITVRDHAARIRRGRGATVASAALSILACEAAFPATASAEAVIWQNNSNDRLWSNPVNWSPGRLPTIADDILLTLSTAPASGVMDLNGQTTSANVVHVSNGIKVLQNGILAANAINVVGGTFSVNGSTLRAANSELRLSNAGGSVSLAGPIIADRFTIDAGATVTAGIVQITAPSPPAVNQIGELVIRNGGTVQTFANFDDPIANPLGNADVTLDKATLVLGARANFDYGSDFRVVRDSAIAIRPLLAGTTSLAATIGSLELDNSALSVLAGSSGQNMFELRVNGPTFVHGDAVLNLTIDSQIGANGRSRVVMNGGITGDGALRVLGRSSEVVLNAPSTHTGGTIASGELRRGNQMRVLAMTANALGTGPVGVENSALLHLGATGAAAGDVNVTSGTVQYHANAAAGGHVISAVGNGRDPLPPPDANQLTQMFTAQIGQIELGSSVTSYGGDRFRVASGNMIGGDAQRLAMLNRDRGGGDTGNVELAPGAVVVHRNVSGGEIADLGTAADLIYGVAFDEPEGVRSPATLSIGAGTPWRGITTDRLSTDRRFFGHLHVNGDFTIGGARVTEDSGATGASFANPSLLLGDTVSNPPKLVVHSAAPVNALVTGAVNVHSADLANVTLRVQAGGRLRFTSLFNASGAIAEPGGIIVLARDSSSLTNSVVDGPVTIQPGGVLSLDGADAPVGTGALSLSPGSIIDLHRQNQLTGSWITPQSIPSGAVVRLRNTQSFGVSAFSGIGQTQAGTILQVIEPNAGITGAGDVTLNGQHLTDSGLLRYLYIALPNHSAGNLVIGPAGATMSATTGTTFQIEEAVTGGTGRSLTLGAAEPVAGEIKGGTMMFSGAVNVGNVDVRSGGALFSSIGSLTADSVRLFQGNGPVEFAGTTTMQSLTVDEGAGPVTVSKASLTTGMPSGQVVRGRFETNSAQPTVFKSLQRVGSISGKGTIFVEDSLWFGGDQTDLTGVTFTGKVTGSGSIVKSASNTTWNFAGEGTNSGGLIVGAGVVKLLPGSKGFTGGIRVSSGLSPAYLSMSADDQMGALTNKLRLSAGRLTITESFAFRHPIELMGSIPLTGFEIPANLTLNVETPISGAGWLWKHGPGTLVLSASGSYQGPTEVVEGTLQLGTDNAIPSLSNVNIQAQSVFDTNGFSASARGLSGNGRLQLGGQGVFDVGNGNYSSTFSGTVAGTGKLSKTGTGRLTFAAGATISNTGGMTINGGAVLVNGPSSLSGGITVRRSGTASGVLEVGADDRLGAPSNAVTLAGGVLRPTASFVSARSFVLGNASGNADGTFDVPAANTTLALTGEVSGACGLTKTGAGTLELRSAVTYRGVTSVGAGTLVLTDTGAVTNPKSVFQIDAGANLVLQGLSKNVGALFGSGAVNLQNTTLTLGSQGGDSNFGGTIAGTGMLVRANADGITTINGILSTTSGGVRVDGGTLNLSGANTFTGDIRLNGGRLTATGNASLGNSANAVTLAGGALQLDGTFTISRSIAVDPAGGAIAVRSGSHVTLDSPMIGSGAFQLAQFQNGVHFEPAGTLELSAASNTFTGAILANSGTLRMSGLGALPAADAWTIDHAMFAIDESSGDLNRLSDDAGITLIGGTLSYTADELAISEHIGGGVIAGSGDSFIQLTGGGGTLILDSLSRLGRSGSRLDISAFDGVLGIDYQVKLTNGVLPGSWVLAQGGPAQYLADYGIVPVSFVPPEGLMSGDVAIGFIPEPAVGTWGLLAAAAFGMKGRRKRVPRSSRGCRHGTVRENSRDTVRIDETPETFRGVGK